MVALAKQILAGGGGSPVPKLYIGDLTISADTTDANDVVITGSLTVQAGFAYTVKGNLQVYGNITNAGTLTCLSLDCGGNVDNTGATIFTVNGECKITGNFINDVCATTTGPLTVNGNITNSGTLTCLTLDCGGNVDNTGATSFTVNGDIRVARNITNTTGIFEVYGNVLYAGNILQQDMTNVGSIYISGNLHCQTFDIIDGASYCEVDGDAILYALDLEANSFISGNTHIETTITIAAGATITASKLEVDGNITNAGTLTCLSLDCGGNVDNTGATIFTVNGECKITGNFINDVCATTTGPLTVNGNITNSVAGVITSNGGVLLAGTLTNAGTINNNTYHYP